MNRLFFALCVEILLGLTVISIGLCAPAAAQAVKPPLPIWQPPRLTVPGRVDQAIQLQSLRIRADIRGRFAQTDIEMTFFNPNQRVLEGELQFPLLPGQSMAGFAMDVNGVLREAVPVEKARGQAVFEDVIRGNIDPGLLEVTQGNNFKLRVYPLPAQGRKQVVLRISETLADSGGRSIYRLPLGFADRVGSVELSVHVTGARQAPQVGVSALGEAHFRPVAEAWQLRTIRTDFVGDGMLAISIQSPAGAFIDTQLFAGKTYFVADVPVNSKESARAIPNRVGIVWDSSGSGEARDHGRELALLDVYFKKMRNGDVRLTRIRDVVEDGGNFRVRDGEWNALRAALVQTAYDGASNLGAFVPDATTAEYLLFSDGLANYGDQPFAKTAVPLYAISAAAKSDATFLNHIAQCSGGRLIDLLTTTHAAAARSLLNARTRIAALDAADASQLVTASAIPQGGRVLVAGVLNEAETTLRIQLQSPSGKQDAIEIPIKRSASPGTIAAGLWAQLRVNELEGEYEFNRAEIRRIGTRFNLVTRETSLIVLDRVEDYARYDIAPPPDLRAAYEQIVATALRRRRNESSAHLDNIVRLFAEKTAWWHRDFPKDSSVKTEAKIAANTTPAVTVGMGTPAREVAERRRDELSRLPQQSGAARAGEAPQSAPPAPAALAAPNGMASANAPRSTLVAGQLMAEARQKTAGESTVPLATIRLQKWQPDAPYAIRLRSASAADLYRLYLDEKPSHANSTAFYLDVADIFFDKGLNALGVRVLSNLAEMDLENRHILRVLGYRLMQAKQPAIAISVFKKVLALSPDEPQSYRDLGLALAADQQPQRAIDALYDVVIRPWNNRFPEIELITLAELNAIVATSNTPLDTRRIDTRLLKNLPLDLRAVLTWDADNTDIDLWVTDPNGEKAFYGHRLTYQGGRMSQDFTGGYGPEEFSLKTAKPGKYKIEAQYYGDRRQNLTGATTLQVNLATHFGTATQAEQRVTLRLKDRQEVVFVGEFEIK